jgi:hypothetical protein
VERTAGTDQVSAISLQFSTTLAVHMPVTRTLNDSLLQLVDQGLVGLALPCCQPARLREEWGVSSDRDELLRPACHRRPTHCSAPTGTSKRQRRLLLACANGAPWNVARSEAEESRLTGVLS